MNKTRPVKPACCLRTPIVLSNQYFQSNSRMRLYAVCSGKWNPDIVATRNGNPTLSTTEEVTEFTRAVLAENEIRKKSQFPPIRLISVGSSKLSQKEIARAIIEVAGQENITSYLRGDDNYAQIRGGLFT